MAGSTGRTATVGVVGESSGATGALADSGASVVRDDAAAVLAADPDWVVAADEAALLDLVAAGVECPVLPVAAGRGVRAIESGATSEAVEAVLDGNAERTTRQLLSVAVGDEAVGTALLDVFLVTAEPARIGEYEVRAGSGDGHPVGRVRADGVVLATPAGSVGYARAVGGPELDPGTGSLSVVPVAPFETDAEEWVVDDAAVAVGVERDVAVSLVVDGRERREIGPDRTVRVRADGSLSVLVTPQSPPVHGRELEKH